MTSKTDKVGEYNWCSRHQVVHSIGKHYDSCVFPNHEKLDKVGEIFKSIFDSFLYALGSPTCMIDLTKIQQQARHALLEVIKAELPKEKELDYSSDSFISCNTNALMGYNQALTEVNAILERLFLGEEK